MKFLVETPSLPNIETDNCDSTNKYEDASKVDNVEVNDLVLEWAGKVFKCHFSSLRELSVFLVKRQHVDCKTPVASTVITLLNSEQRSSHNIEQNRLFKLTNPTECTETNDQKKSDKINVNSKGKKSKKLSSSNSKAIEVEHKLNSSTSKPIIKSEPSDDCFTSSSVSSPRNASQAVINLKI